MTYYVQSNVLTQSFRPTNVLELGRCLLPSPARAAVAARSDETPRGRQ
jgi:hypothetical protein